MSALTLLLALATLDPVAFLVGEWSGTGKHPYGEYRETQRVTRALDDTVIEMRTVSRMGERTVHEDLRVISVDPKTGKIRMRQWAKGWLRIYEGEVREEGEVVFTQTATEGGGDDRWRYTLTPRKEGGFDYRVEVNDKPFVSGALRADIRDPGKGGGLGIRELEATIDGMKAQVHHPDGEGPYPVIVFSPGGNAQTFQGYRPYGRFWATWGYITVIVAFNDADAAERAPKFGKVLDWALTENARDGSPLKGMVDSKRLAVAGHSRGGAAALRASRTDERVVACLALAPSGPAEAIDGKGRGESCVIVGGADDLREAGRKAHATLPGKPLLLVIADMDHMLGPREATLKLVSYATAFWNAALQGDQRYRSFLR